MKSRADSNGAVTLGELPDGSSAAGSRASRRRNWAAAASVSPRAARLSASDSIDHGQLIAAAAPGNLGALEQADGAVVVQLDHCLAGLRHQLVRIRLGRGRARREHGGDGGGDGEAERGADRAGREAHGFRSSRLRRRLTVSPARTVMLKRSSTPFSDTARTACLPGVSGTRRSGVMPADSPSM